MGCGARNDRLVLLDITVGWSATYERLAVLTSPHRYAYGCMANFRRGGPIGRTMAIASLTEEVGSAVGYGDLDRMD